MGEVMKGSVIRAGVLLAVGFAVLWHAPKHRQATASQAAQVAIQAD